eukprot:TRINITY_DN19800_c0_g1_i3.p1 TRINITY_DN19800_c0_g1~~TRINITY_DN19800_c0_g1_i3.p1  ORF type:complete len:478 (+),score=34.52 TRINITY_DN19800_c0_g1_i3:42-1436(+)
MAPTRVSRDGALVDALSSPESPESPADQDLIPRQSSVGRQILLLAVTFLVGWLTIASFVLLPFMGKRFFSDGVCVGNEKSDLCDKATSKAAGAMGLALAGTSLTCFFTGPVVGALSDARGRLPFVIASLGLQGLMVGSMAAYQFDIMSLNVHYVLRGISGLIQPLPLLYSMAADETSPAQRGVVFGRMAACFSLATLFAPALMAALPDAAGVLALVASALLAVILILVHGESLPVQGRSTVEGGPVRMCCKASTAILILNRNCFFRCLAVVVLVSSITSSGAQTTFISYLESVLGVDKAGTAVFLSVMGGSGVLVLTLLAPVFLRKFGVANTISIGLFMSIAGNVFMIVGNLPWINGYYVVLACCAMEGFGLVVIPCVTTLKSNASSQAEQGSVQGAISSAQQLGTTIGHLVYSQVFKVFNAVKWDGQPMPGFTYTISMGLSGICLMVVCCCLKEPSAKPNECS